MWAASVPVAPLGRISTAPLSPSQKSSSALVFAVSLMAVAILVLAGPSLCSGGGIFHVFPPTVRDIRFAVARPTVSFSRALLTVSESRIEYRIEQTFFNDNEFPLDGLYILPLDGKEFVERPSAKIDGVTVPVKLVSGQDFLPTLIQLTQSMGDPSLLGLAGRTVLVIRPVTIGIRGHRTFRIEYVRPISIHQDQMTLTLPLDGERYALAPVAKQEIKVRFKMSRPVRSIFSPSHHLTVLREAPHRCLVTVETESKKVRGDFSLLATFSGTTLNLRTFFYRRPGHTGTFMGLIEPPVESLRSPHRAKNVAILLDCSGSMSASSFELAKSAAVSALARLGDGDRFNVVTIGTHPEAMSSQLVRATRKNVERAVRFVNSRKNAGGTDLYNGLRNALEFFPSRGRHSIILLVSDGRSTVGITKPESIIQDLEKHNRSKTRIFVLALGKEADMSMLDRLAVATKGSSLHLPEAEAASEAVNRFLGKISAPNVADISLECGSFPISEMAPTPIPDLFGQESLAVFARYRAQEPALADLKLRARVNGRSSKVNKAVSLSETGDSSAYIPRLWAMRRIAYFHDKIRLKGPTPDLVSRMRSLANKFGFVAPPLTLFAGAPYDEAVSGSDPGRLVWNYKTSCVPSDVLSKDSTIVGEKVFKARQEGWVDTEYVPKLPITHIRFLSEEYFTLLRDNPRVGRYLALGPNLIFVWQGTAYRIVAEP